MGDILSNLIHRWPFDASLADAAGGGDMTLTAGAIAAVAGRVDQALAFTSAGTADAGDLAGADFGVSDSFTIAGWIRLETRPAAAFNIFHKFESSPGGWVIWITPAAGDQIFLNAQAKSGAAVSQWRSASLTAGAWYHFAYVGDRLAGADTLYINGAVSGSFVGGTPLSGVGDLSNAAAVTIGSDADGVPYLDDFRIYNRALTAGDVADLHAFTGGFTNGPGYLVFRRATPSAPDELIAELDDLTLTHTLTGLTADSLGYYYIDAVSACGVRSVDNIAHRLRRVAMDGSNQLIPPAPHPPFGLTLARGAGGLVTAEWRHRDTNAEADAAGFNVYVATGATPIDYGSIDFAVAQGVTSQALGTFSDATTVRCVVRARTAGGVEETNTTEAATTADAAAPPPPETILTA